MNFRKIIGILDPRKVPLLAFEIHRQCLIKNRTLRSSYCKYSIKHKNNLIKVSCLVTKCY